MFLIRRNFTGTELTKANLHTADGISVRFPRVTRIRTDKDWESATNLDELKHLYKTSKEKTDVSLLTKLAATTESDEPPKKKIKDSPGKAKGSVKETPNSKKVNTLHNFFSPPNAKIFDQDSISSKSKKDDHNLDTSESDESHSKNKSKKRKLKAENSDDDVNAETDIKKESKKIKRESKTNESRSNSSNEMDTETNSSKKSSKFSIENELLTPENPLPDVFNNKRVGFYPDFISFPEEERSFLERHWVAYGGEVVKSIRLPNIDYLVHKDDSIEFECMKKLKKKIDPNVRHVNKNWIVKCINDVVLYDATQYPVIIEP